MKTWAEIKASAGMVAEINTFFTPKGEEPWGWRTGCVEAHAQGGALAGIAAAGLACSTGAELEPHGPHLPRVPKRMVPRMPPR